MPTDRPIREPIEDPLVADFAQNPTKWSQEVSPKAAAALNARPGPPSLFQLAATAHNAFQSYLHATNAEDFAHAARDLETLRKALDDLVTATSPPPGQNAEQEGP